MSEGIKFLYSQQQDAQKPQKTWPLEPQKMAQNRLRSLEVRSLKAAQNRGSLEIATGHKRPSSLFKSLHLHQCTACTTQCRLLGVSKRRQILFDGGTFILFKAIIDINVSSIPLDSAKITEDNILTFLINFVM